MTIKIIYQGDIGKGEFDIDIEEGLLITDLIDIFHEKIDTSRNYKLRAGRPPNRKTILVAYDYELNGIKIEDENLDDMLEKYEIVDNSIINFKLDSGGKVD